MKKFTRLSILLALSVALNILETALPLFETNIPGLRLGLANIVTLFIIYQYDLKDAFYVGILRVFLVGILRTGLFSTTFFFSLSGVILSIIFMYLAKKFLKLSIVGVSIVGSVAHCVGQIIMAILILKMDAMIYYLPWLLLFAIPSGILVGIICKQLIKYFDDVLLFE